MTVAAQAITVGGITAGNTAQFVMQPIVCKADILADIVTFFKCNTLEATTTGVRWEAFKVYIGGMFISREDGVLKMIRNDLIRSEAKLCQLELDCTSAADPIKLAQIREELEVNNT